MIGADVVRETEGVCGGYPCVGMSRIPVRSLVLAYRQLQDEGVVDSVRGTGLAVAADVRRMCRDQRRQLLRERLGQALGEAVRAGLEAEEIQQLVAAELRKLNRNKG